LPWFVLPVSLIIILEHRTIVESELFVPLIGTIGKDNDIVITNLTTENHTVIEDPVKEVRLAEDLNGRVKLLTPKPNKM
jgi:hypothetical protein